MKFKIIKEDEKKAVVKYIDSLKITKPLTVVIEKQKTIRSKDQNRLYWLWINCLHDETGNDKDTIHEFLKAKFLGFQEKEIFESNLTTVNSTKSLTENEMAKFMQDVKIWASTELAITLPIPEDLFFEAFHEKYN